MQGPDVVDAAPSDGGSAPSIPEVEERFRELLDRAAREPLREAIERYHRSLLDIVAETQTAAGQGLESGLAERDPRARYEFADRFATAFRQDILDPADRDREDLFRWLDALPERDPHLPETVTAGPAEPGAAAPRRVRARPGRRLLSRVKRGTDRTVPTGPLARLYLAELAARLEGAAHRAARLESVALANLLRDFRHRGSPVGEPAVIEGGGDLSEGVAAFHREVGEAVADVEAEFARAIRAPAVHVGEDDARATADRAAQRRERLLGAWQSFETALRWNTRSEAFLARSLAALHAATQATVKELEAVLDGTALEPLARGAAELERLADDAERRLGDGVDPELVESLRARAAAVFRTETLSLTGRLAEGLRDATERYVAELAAIPEAVPGELKLSEERIARIPDRPDTLALREAPVEELLATACAGTIPRWIDRALSGTTVELDALAQELSRVRNAVDFHIRAPLRGHFGDGEAADLIVDSLRRAAAQLEELRETGLDPVERLVTELERLSAAEVEAVWTAVAEREFLRIRSEIAEEQAARGISKGVAWGRRLVEAGLRVARAGWSAGRRTYGMTQDWAERQLGVGDIEREDMLESLDASLLGDRLDRLELPGLYRQLMDVEDEVPWDELLVPREEEVATLRRAVDRWRRGQAASVAVVGEKGSGKTTVLRMAAGLFDDTPVHTLDLGSTIPEPDRLVRRIAEAVDLSTGDWTELASMLRASGRAVVIVEDAHHMFIRALGGFQAMESFLELLAATRQHVLWVVTADEYAWRYLDRVMGIAPHFTHTINTTNLSAEHLERAIMARHEVSGFSLRFELDEDPGGRTGWWRRLRKKETQGELTRREVARRAFFRELNQIAEGNIFLALFYWLRSVDRIEDHTLVLGSPRIIDLEFLDRLPLPSLHTIAGIILHGGLSEEEHRRVFQLDTSETRLQLAALSDAHLVFRSGDGEYKVNKVLYRPLTRLLKARNIF